jgi:NAD(P)-dependent dehydrogenase (short-subunit alcohol dehydrogenase family)
MELRLGGKVVLVTGASSGIGAGLAEGFARAGAATVLSGRDEAALERTRAVVEAAGASALTVAADLTSPGSPRDVVAAALSAFGRLDVLVHAAGVYERAPLAEAQVDVLDRQWEVNVRAPYALTQAALPALVESSGSVLFFGSRAGQVGLADRAAYAATKGAVEAMVRALAVELAPLQVRVNAIVPGFVETPMNERLRADPAVTAYTTSLIPAGRIGRVQDIVPAAVYLASDAAGYVTGAALAVDGGYPAPPPMDANA